MGGTDLSLSPHQLIYFTYSDSALEAGHEVLFAAKDSGNQVSPYVAVPYTEESELRRLLGIPVARSDAVIRRSVEGMTIEGDVRRRRQRIVLGP